jgi:hypothetical protein
MIAPLVLGAVALYALSQMGSKKTAPAQANTVTGPSGTPWAFALVRSGIDPVTKLKTDIFDLYLLPNGTPVAEYAQTPDGKITFLSSPMQANDPILVKAKSDFQMKG